MGDVWRSVALWSATGPDRVTARMVLVGACDGEELVGAGDGDKPNIDSATTIIDFWGVDLCSLSWSLSLSALSAGVLLVET